MIGGVSLWTRSGRTKQLSWCARRTTLVPMRRSLKMVAAMGLATLASGCGGSSSPSSTSYVGATKEACLGQIADEAQQLGRPPIDDMPRSVSAADVQARADARLALLRRQALPSNP